MSGARIACVMATQGRESLRRAVRSVLTQDVRPDDCLIVVVDCRDAKAMDWGVLADVELNLVRPNRHRLIIDWVYHQNDRPTFSHEQAAYGVSLVPEGHWISLLGDDDIYLPGAWAAIRERAEAGPPRPILFRMNHNAAGIIWHEVGLVREACISEQNLIVPKLPGLIGAWDFNRYAGDFDWVASTLALWAERGVAPEWDQTVIQFSRPVERGYANDL